jgi:hypothetical protein
LRRSCFGSRLGGEVALLNVAPDGRNINLNCGALHPAYVAAEVARAERIWASPLTATPTAVCWPARTTTSSTAMRFC